MSQLSVNLRLRPIRFGFMARPDDSANLRRIFRLNTCLWGGLYNPIIPFFKRVPAWWERNGVRFDSAEQIINGYLDYFEPDFVVEATKGISAGFGVDPDRVLQLSDILPRSDQRNDRGYGQSVLNLYQKLYREEFKFVLRHKHDIVSPKAAERSLADFVSCLFGSFPTESNLAYFGKAFEDAFGPQEVVLDGASLAKLYRTGCRSALRLGSSGLDINFTDHSDPTLFILNAEDPKDLLDFWNYRAVYRSGLAIPIQWLEQLSDFCKEFITRNHRSLPGNPHGVMIRPVCMFSRSIPEKDIKDLHATYLNVDKDGANTLQTWYPSFWRPTPDYVARTTRPTITAAEKRLSVAVDVEADKPSIQFDSLHPDFAIRFGGKARWANVVRLKEWGSKDSIATVFPTDFRVEALPKYRLGESLLSTTEGLVSFSDHKDIGHYWRLVEGKQAIEAWLERTKVSCRLSESGRATQQIIQTLGGFWGVRSIAHKQVVDLLDEMARRPITHSTQHQKFRNLISNAMKGDIWRDRVLETLVDRKAVELGQELKCSKCGSWSWYALNQLDTTVTCGLCLQQFGFPLANPTGSDLARWAYRVVGPFALPAYAAGGYAAALAIRFFADVLGHVDSAETSWSPGQELTLADGNKIEADLLLWYQRKHPFGTDEHTQVVFGEAKSFGKDAFRNEDVERMKALAELHPGAALVFATMKQGEDLSADEVKRIRKLAEWGREYDKERRETRAPVIVLTGLELFTPRYLETVWKAKGGKHQQLVEPGYVQIENLRTLADCTQQLYLGMPSYFEWREAKWKKHRERRQRTASDSQRVRNQSSA